MLDEDVISIVGEQRFDSGDDEFQFIAESWCVTAAIVYDALYNDYFIDMYEQYADFMRQATPNDVTAKVWQTIASYKQQLERHHLRLGMLRHCCICAIVWPVWAESRCNIYLLMKCKITRWAQLATSARFS